MYNLVLMAALATGGEAPAWCHGCHGCHGCCGGCYGGCYGCYGCHGCHGCWGGCYGGCYGCYGCHGCYGGCYGCYGGCYGCYGGCYGCYGGGYAVTPYLQVAPTTPGTPAPEQAPAPKKEKETSDATSRARLVVELPTDAKLFIDDQQMKAASERRTFRTPVLDKGQAYFYDLRAELVRDGKVQSQSKRVIVRAGEEVRTSFPELQSTATATAELRQR